MKIHDIESNEVDNDWSDEEIIISLESARKNLEKLRDRHPDKCRVIPNNLKPGKDLLAKAKQLHSVNKDASMFSVSIESYCSEFNLDSDAKILLESIIEENK